MNKIYVVGIGPGGSEYLTPQAVQAIELSEVIVGYSVYLELIQSLISKKEQVSTGMKKERDRALQAFQLAEKGQQVAVISSGDAEIYGMASLMWEMKHEMNFDTELEIVPGISAMFAAGAKLGAPLGHDFCSISLSDLLTPWSVIEKRIEAAALADFVTAIYNPVSKGRFWQLMRLKDIFLQNRDPKTPIGICSHVGREKEEVRIIYLEELEANMADMFTVLIIGNSQSRIHDNHFYTPRGYYAAKEENLDPLGRSIMNESFSIILRELKPQNTSLEKLWVALHTIHTTADLNFINHIEISPDVVPQLNQAFFSGKPPVIVTDVSMVTNGIRKAIVKELGIEVKCYLDDPRTIELAQAKNITRTQAGIRFAAEEHPDALFVFGNAPTALIELVELTIKGKATPKAVIAAPVGFVNVKESKWQLKYGCPNTPHIIITDRKGGSNVAATIVNAILSWADAEAMRPGLGINF